jgi:hypothetical protein
MAASEDKNQNRDTSLSEHYTIIGQASERESVARTQHPPTNIAKRLTLGQMPALIASRLHQFQSKLALERVSNSRQVSCPFGRSAMRLKFNLDGDRHEETDISRRSAGNDCGFHVGG